MKNRLLPKLSLWLFLLSLLPGASIAREPVEVRIDLLVFRHNTAPDEQVDDILNVPRRSSDIIQPSARLASATSDSELRFAEPGALEKQSAKIENSENFDLLHRVSWRQPVYTPQNAPYVSLSPDPCCGLTQAVAKVFFERYFQLVINLLYDPDLGRTIPTEQDTPENKTIFIRMRRTMADDTLYYLDHPLLGVIVKVTVIEATDS